MNNNIFVKNKSNPDVLKNKSKLEIERNSFQINQSKFLQNNNNILKPVEITSENNKNIELLINEKTQERTSQDLLFKPIKQKIMLNDNNEINNSINNFNELKNEQTEFSNNQKQQIINNKTKYNNIINNLRKNGLC